MLKINNGPITYLRFGITRKKDFLKDTRKAYDGIVLPANILLYQYKSTPSVIYMCQQPFFIDPMSYLFGQPFESFKQKVKFKPSFHKLMDGHGLSPEKFIHSNYIDLLRTLSTTDNLEKFIDKALRFQYDNVWDTLQNAKDLIGQDLEESKYRPQFLIPPYFLYMPIDNSSHSITTNLNRRILDYCSRQRKYTDIFPMVCITKEHLGTKFIDDVIEIVKQHDFYGYVIWVEDFDERFVSKNQIKGLISLTHELAKNGKQLVMLYGGFFSLILSFFGMNCVCHGLAYGEARTITASAQENAGPAPVRYYLKDLHTFLTLENALIVLRKNPDLICTCSACQRIIRNNPENVTRFQSEEALAEMHFLYNRYQERKMISTCTLSEIIEHLDWIIKLYDDIKTITKTYKTHFGLEEKAIIDPKYIINWKEALEESKELALR